MSPPPVVIRRLASLENIKINIVFGLETKLLSYWRIRKLDLRQVEDFFYLIFAVKKDLLLL